MNRLDLAFALLFIFILIWLVVLFKYGDWKNWKRYYPTILFFYCGNLIAFSVFHSNLLWELKSNILTHSLTDLIQMVFVFTPTAIMFLQYFPKNIKGQEIYIILWVFIYSTIEFIFHKLGSIEYNRGWTIWWSASHNLYQFILLRIYFNNPLLAWCLAVIMLIIMIRVFNANLLYY